MEMGEYVNVPEAKKKNLDTRPLPGSWVITVVAVSFGLLCVLQVSLNISLRLIYWRNWTDKSQINQTEEIHQLQISYDKLSNEKGQLQISYDKLSDGKGQLQNSYDRLANEKGRLQNSYDRLANEKGQLQNSYDRLVNEKGQLQNSYDRLVNEKGQLQNSYDRLVNEKRQLQIGYDRLVNEIRQLQIGNDKLSDQKRQLNSRIGAYRLCDNGWTRLDSSCYYISTEQKTWEESRQDCTRRGARLVIINSVREQISLTELKLRVWIGLSEISNGIWQWVDGSTVSIGYWTVGEPNNFEGNPEGCVEIRPLRDDNNIMNWNDEPCHFQRNWVCEI
ncbi:C-type lectin domain family 4 member M-like [Hypomesus transpacificus]|uniref:C-type lectin domain family 4 member M-like n=1 Tax=Hypomesus transpacificus TaxID=137520 RepID=UPI001F0758F9|nr:C-type lectin domain family 4 member M-like [Hypomesus transpacificus]